MSQSVMSVMSQRHRGDCCSEPGGEGADRRTHLHSQGRVELIKETGKEKVSSRFIQACWPGGDEKSILFSSGKFDCGSKCTSIEWCFSSENSFLDV